MARAGRASPHTSRFTVFLGQVFIVNPVDAQRAFFHHAGYGVQFPSAIRTSPGTQPATDAIGLVDQNNPVLDPLETRARWTNRDTRRVFAMQTGFRKMHSLCRRVFGLNFERMHPVQKRPRRCGPVSINIRQWRAVMSVIPAFAGNHTGLTPDTSVQINHQSQFPFGGLR